ncbi:CopG family transcriptional regulator [Brevundimonas sp. GCM10030266]|uniref:CopG family transcriptional regulator n=1 Tax=Brevundimonas sp. GCM10030266 TaxID=3273386 RepID=UPI00361A120F
MDEADKHFAEEPVAFDAEDASVPDAREQQALADIAAGRFISNDAMVRWLRTWGDETPSPPPECGE